MPQYLKMFIVYGNVYVYQFWCFYHEVNDWLSMSDYAAAL